MALSQRGYDDSLHSSGPLTFSPLDCPNLAHWRGLDSFGRVAGGQMQVNHQQCWSFALSGAWQYAPETKAGVLRRTLRRVGGQIIVLAFVLLDIAGLVMALAASIWLAPWAAINATALVLGSLSWSEDRRIQRESATATRRHREERQREAERQQQA